MPVNNQPSQILAGGRRYPASSSRILLLAIGILFLYAAGLGSGGWAATLSLAEVRAGREVPVLPWLAALVFMVSGMLSVVYGFFFRPRAVEVNDEEVAFVKWDGKAKSLRRDEVKAVRESGGRLILEGEGKSLVIRSHFEGWDALQADLARWALAPGVLR